MFGNFIMTARLRQKTFCFDALRLAVLISFPAFHAKNAQNECFVKLLICCEIRAFVNECANVKNITRPLTVG